MTSRTPSDTKKTVWLLSDGLAGHYNQSIGICNAIQSHLPDKPLIINVRIRYKLLRPLMRLIANRAPQLLGLKAFSFFYKHEPLPSTIPKLIISAGGNTLFSNISLSAAYQATNIFSGTLKGYEPSHVSKIFTVTPLRTSRNNIILDLPPANIQQFSNSKPTNPKPCYALLIGGNGAGYQYTEQDWRQLSTAMEIIAKRDKITWQLTTSRRTGKEIEQLLKSIINKEILTEAIWFSLSPQKVINRFLKESRTIFCTEDSLTMVSEAIYSHKPVVTLQPESMRPDNNDAQALNKYKEKKFIIRSPIKQLQHQKLDESLFCQNFPDVQKQIVDAIFSPLKSKDTRHGNTHK